MSTEKVRHHEKEPYIQRQLMARLFNANGVFTTHNICSGGATVEYQDPVPIGPFRDYMHKPHFQLRAIWEHFQKLPYEAKYTGRVLEQQHPFVGTTSVHLTQPLITPDSLLSFTINNPENGAAGALLRDRVEEAKNIFLAGCIGGPSAQRLVKKLSELNFNGTLHIHDIAPEPLLIANIFSDVLDWENRYSISTKFQVSDLTGSTGFPSDLPMMDILFADVLGHYMTDIHLTRSLPALLQNMVRPGGLALIRDVLECDTINQEKRMIEEKPQKPDRQVDILDATDDDIQYCDWLNAQLRQSAPHLPAEVQLSDIVSSRRVMWPPVTHRSRINDYYGAWTNVMAGYHPELLNISTAVDTGENHFADRLFQISMYQIYGGRLYG